MRLRSLVNMPRPQIFLFQRLRPEVKPSEENPELELLPESEVEVKRGGADGSVKTGVRGAGKRSVESEDRGGADRRRAAALALTRPRERWRNEAASPVIRPSVDDHENRKHSFPQKGRDRLKKTRVSQKNGNNSPERQANMKFSGKTRSYLLYSVTLVLICRDYVEPTLTLNGRVSC